jgi:hypothetical protein
MAERVLFADTVEELTTLAVGDRTVTDAVVQAHADQVLAQLSDALADDATEAERIAALIDVFMHAALQRLVSAARSDDRIAFAEAEICASAVASTMDRAADAAARGDRSMIAAAMTAAEAVLGTDLRFLLGLLL